MALGFLQLCRVSQNLLLKSFVIIQSKNYFDTCHIKESFECVQNSVFKMIKHFPELMSICSKDWKSCKSTFSFENFFVTSRLHHKVLGSFLEGTFEIQHSELSSKMSHVVTKPTMWLCAQQRLRSASAQSDQSLCCALNG